MNENVDTAHPVRQRVSGCLILIAGLILTAMVYWPGLSGGWLFDDYPNIVDNKAVQPGEWTPATIVRAALSSPASEFKRPLASLSFAANYVISGLDPYWMKLTNLIIHLINGCLIYWLTRLLFRAAGSLQGGQARLTLSQGIQSRASAAIAVSWMFLPINLTAVLYVVQREESLANLFVLLGVIGYTCGRLRMRAGRRGGFAYALVSIALMTGIGFLVKETAVLLPLYALAIEWALFRFRVSDVPESRLDKRIISLFVFLLLLPMLGGLAWLIPRLLRPESWATRNFSIGTRLLSECRIVWDYVLWILLPIPGDLSFYHDDFVVSTSLVHPWTTLPAIAGIGGLVFLPFVLRQRHPLAALGLALFIAAHTLTATILPLELIYEHRNYFASYCLLLTIVPWFCTRTSVLPKARHTPLAWISPLLLTSLMLFWCAQTAMTAVAWGEPLELAKTLAARSPQSPRSQYELGRTYILYSHYDPLSRFVPLAHSVLGKAARLPNATILPEQALIFMNSRMRLPLEDAWWDTMISKLQARKPGVQDESSLSALTHCAVEQHCLLPEKRMKQAFAAAISHPDPSARLLATYSNYAWDILDDKQLGLRLVSQAVSTKPTEAAYRVTEIRMLVALGHLDAARGKYKKLARMNIGGELNDYLSSLRSLIDR